jgi:predicted transposase YdaD
MALIPLEQLRESSFYQYILEEGREEGARRQVASMLGGLVQQRFGELPDSIRQKIGGAALATLEKWSLRLLDAASLDELFAES